MFVHVKFDSHSAKTYVYRTPVVVHKGDIVLVSVLGEIKAAIVESTSKTARGFSGNINTIVGLGWRLEELETISSNQPKQSKLKAGLQFIAEMIE